MRVPAGFAAIGFAVLVAACSGGDDEQARKADQAPTGGTLRIGITAIRRRSRRSIPRRSTSIPPITELQRCCLLRTLVNYRGATTEEGGSVLRPDLAEALPKVSEDGLAYTFRLRSGFRYAPPYEDVTIKAQDIVRAIEYALRLESADRDELHARDRGRAGVSERRGRHRLGTRDAGRPYARSPSLRSVSAT